MTFASVVQQKAAVTPVRGDARVAQSRLEGGRVMARERGSEKLLAAWKNRALTDESVREIAAALDKSPAVVEHAAVFGGANATGVALTLSYSGDDVPMCGNDLSFWFNWHRRFGGLVRPPKIIINGIPVPDVVRVHLEFGNVRPLEQLEMSELKDLRQLEEKLR
jgi:hypothetical protein